MEPPGDTQLPILDYMNVKGPPNVRVDIHEGGGVTVIVPTRRSLVLFLVRVAAQDLLAFLLIPFATVIYLLSATRRPRAVFRMTSAELTVEESLDESLGWFAKRRSWPRSEIGELRPNRFSPAIYLTVPGKGLFDLLEGATPETIAVVAKALDDARTRLAKPNPKFHR